MTCLQDCCKWKRSNSILPRRFSPYSQSWAECRPEHMLWLESGMKHFGSSTGTPDSWLQIVQIVAKRLECQERRCPARERQLMIAHWDARVGSIIKFYHLISPNIKFDIQPPRSFRLPPFSQVWGHAWAEDPTVDATQTLWRCPGPAYRCALRDVAMVMIIGDNRTISMVRHVFSFSSLFGGGIKLTTTHRNTLLEATGGWWSQVGKMLAQRPGRCKVQGPAARWWTLALPKSPKQLVRRAKTSQNGGFHKWGYPKWMVYKGKSHLEMDDLGVPPCQETSKWQHKYKPANTST